MLEKNEYSREQQKDMQRSMNDERKKFSLDRLSTENREERTALMCRTLIHPCNIRKFIQLSRTANENLLFFGDENDRKRGSGCVNLSCWLV